MDIARTSMIHARAPRFLWPYPVRYAAHQLNLRPHVSRPEASPTSLWTGSPGVGSVFRVWGCLALVRDTSADKILARAIPYVFLGFPVASPSPQSSSQSPQQPSALPRQVTVDSGGVGAGGAAAGGTQAEGARLRGVGAGVAGTGGASSGGVGAGGTGTEGASSGGVGAGSAGTRGASSGGVGAGGAGSRGASSGGVGGGGICQRELCVGPRPRLGGANFVVGCTGGTANLQQWATPTWASWSTGLVDLHGATAMPPTWEAGG
ncbi:unnamed protein product [Closterium sp. NIES-54]